MPGGLRLEEGAELELQMVVKCYVCGLGLEPRSYGKAVSPLNHRANPRTHASPFVFCTFIYLFTLCVCVGRCSGLAFVEVREQLSGIGSSSLPCGSHRPYSVRFVSKHIDLLSLLHNQKILCVCLVWVFKTGFICVALAVLELPL